MDAHGKKARRPLDIHGERAVRPKMLNDSIPEHASMQHDELGGHNGLDQHNKPLYIHATDCYYTNQPNRDLDEGRHIFRKSKDYASGIMQDDAMRIAEAVTDSVNEDIGESYGQPNRLVSVSNLEKLMSTYEEDFTSILCVTPSYGDGLDSVLLEITDGCDELGIVLGKTKLKMLVHELQGLVKLMEETNG